MNLPMHWMRRIAADDSETVCGRDAAAEPTGMYSRRVDEASATIRLSKKTYFNQPLLTGFEHSDQINPVQPSSHCEPTQ